MGPLAEYDVGAPIPLKPSLPTGFSADLVNLGGLIVIGQP